MGQNYKHIFIGLGGAGVNTVSLIKKKIYDKTTPKGTRSRLDTMNEKYRFLFFDTDQRDIDKYNRMYRDTFENGIIPFINPQTDLISLSKGNPHAIYEEAKANPTPMINQRILECCSEDVAAKIPDQPLKFGAGAFRMKSRLSFARSLSEFQQKLQAAIEDLNSVKNTGGAENTIFYWVVCSTNGGTGSGIINDVLYYVNMQHKRSIGDGDPHLVLTMYMPKFYIDKNSTEEKYSLNAFAVFKEIEGIKAMSNDPKRNTVFHRLALLKDYNLIKSDERYDPFYYLIPIDCQTDNGTNIGDSLYPNTAEMLYYVHEGEGGEALHSDVDNYMHDLYNARPNGFLVPMGYIALRKPVKEFEDYVRIRLEQDLLVYGICNDDLRGVDNDDKPEIKAKEFYQDLFGDENKQASTEMDCTLYDMKAESLRQTFDDFDNLDENRKRGELKGEDIQPELIKEASRKFENFIADDEGGIRGFNDSQDAVVFKMWEKAEELTKIYGLAYAEKFFEQLKETAKKFVIDFRNDNKDIKTKNETESTRSAKIEEALAPVRDFKMHESKSNQLQDIAAAIGILKGFASSDIDEKIKDIKNKFMLSFCDADGEGKIADLLMHIKAMHSTAKDLATEASDKYSRFAGSLSEKSLDVTSVYLPEMKTICDSSGWIRDNRFARMYQRHIAVTHENIEGKDRKPVRNRGEHSLLTLIENIYRVSQGGNNDDAIVREINKEFSVPGLPERNEDGVKIDGRPQIRFFANEGRVDNNRATIEKFVTYAKNILVKEISQDTEIKENWTNRGVHRFFEDLDSENRERVRRSLNPTLFFNYKENRIAIDYREFLIFVAKDSDVAKDMLGYQEGNPKHRLITVNGEDNAAFVIRSKYGLSFSDYRLYDTMQELYEKAPSRDKYHFHHYYAEYGEDIVPEDLPLEISPAHKTYVKLLIMDKYKDDFKEFFYESPYVSRKDDFADSILKHEADKTFSIARPAAISNLEGKICIKVYDKNASLFSNYRGDNFAEVFKNYQEHYVKNSVEATFEKFLTSIIKHTLIKEVEDKDGETNDGKKRYDTINGNAILIKKFDEHRKTLLNDLDMKVTKSSDEEKNIYKALFYVLDSEIKNVHDFMGK